MKLLPYCTSTIKEDLKFGISDYSLIHRNLSERRYDYGKFDNRVFDFGFPDHHSPPLELLFRIISSIHEFLSESESNVAVVHCTGGKGRTGNI